MTPEESVVLIERAGGDSAFGRLLGIDRFPHWQQRVNNWKRRGIPSEVVVDHYDVITELKERATRRRKKQVV
jgi:hypothetical protein